jgi:hypothetical protein
VRLEPGLSILNHRPELDQPEFRASLADAAMGEEHGSGGFHLDRQGDDQEEGKAHDDEDESRCDIE